MLIDHRDFERALEGKSQKDLIRGPTLECIPDIVSG